VYHAKARDHLSSHALADFRRCPLLFRRKELGLVPERDSAAYRVGRAAHTLILEGRERFGASYAVGGPINPRTGNPYGAGTKAFAAWAQRSGKEVLSDADAAQIEQMHAAVRDHAIARELLSRGVAEGVVRTEYAGHHCQARIDWLRPPCRVACRGNVPERFQGHFRGGLVDLKTCDRLDTFEIDLAAFGYPHQLAFYRALVERACGIELPVYLIAVEKREPYRCGVWRLPNRVLDRAQAENEAAMAELAACRATDTWPTRYESLRVFDRA